MFKQYEDKSSMDKPLSRIRQGGSADVVGSKIKWWERRKIESAPDDIEVTLEKKYEKRPDLVAHTYYGTSELTWLVLLYNHVVDVNEEFLVGTTIKIPSRVRAFAIASTAPNYRIK